MHLAVYVCVCVCVFAIGACAIGPRELKISMVVGFHPRSVIGCFELVGPLPLGGAGPEVLL